MKKTDEVLKEQKIVRYQGYFHKAMKAYAERFGEWLLKESYLPKENGLWCQVKPPYNSDKPTAQLIEMFENN